MKNSQGFPPIAKSNATILILGSMPGQVSLDRHQYYAHPRNSFWSIIFDLLNADSELNYEQRKQLLYDNNIAVWDVLKSCYRRGSLDADIDPATIEANDFKSFFKKHPNIKYIYFNGTKAEQIFNKKVLENLAPESVFKYHRLPSTSPAHAAITRQQKLLEWSVIKKVL
ncbi:MAG: DNA-deoxyinosine glycosylase [Pseudomonadota bacterium]